eukprot:7357643-Prymnesium_polylepis.2
MASTLWPMSSRSVDRSPLRRSRILSTRVPTIVRPGTRGTRPRRTRAGTRPPSTALGSPTPRGSGGLRDCGGCRPRLRPRPNPERIPEEGPAVWV